MSQPLLGAPHSLIEPPSAIPTTLLSPTLNPSSSSVTSCGGCQFDRRSTELLSVFVGSVSPEVDPRLYLASVGQSTLTYAQLISGTLELAESVKLGLHSNNKNDQKDRHESLLSPYCRPSQLLSDFGTVPERLLVGDGKDETLRKRLTDSLLLFLKNYNQQSRGVSSGISSLVHKIISSDNNSNSSSSTSGDTYQQGNQQVNQLSNQHKSFAMVPLIVNTHGWITGLGWQLIEAIGGLAWTTHRVELVKSNDWRSREPREGPKCEEDLTSNEQVTTEQRRVAKSKKTRNTQKGVSGLLVNNKDKDTTTTTTTTSTESIDQHTIYHHVVNGTEISKHGNLLKSGSRSIADQSNFWGPVTTPLEIRNPFTDLVEQFCGRLPLNSDHRDLDNRRLIPCAFRHSKSSIQRKSHQEIRPAHLRWLRFMSLFNFGYRHAVHFPIATHEGQVNSQEIEIQKSVLVVNRARMFSYCVPICRY